jgi:flagellum-specific ATP synthase
VDAQDRNSPNSNPDQEENLKRILFDSVYEEFSKINKETQTCFEATKTASVNLREKFSHALDHFESRQWYGYVSKVIGLLLEAQLPGAKIGEICKIVTDEGVEKLAEVVGFKGQVSLLLLLVDGKGVSQGCRVYPTGSTMKIGLSTKLLGRVINAVGEPMDRKPQIIPEEFRDIEQAPPDSFGRPRIKEVFATGVRAIDSTLTFGEGQRIGLFAGSGVGKSTTMGMIARYSDADINVIALVGERGREVQDFIEASLGEEGMKKSVCVIATGDQPAMMRMKCLLTATTIAEYFRDKGNKVMLMADSVTRMAMAARDVGLAVGEPPTMKGYTPSVFSLIPRVLERAGKSTEGSITAIYAVLVEGDDMNEPIADTVRGVLDGHIVLSRKIAHKNHYPAIDVLGSVSRLFPEITSKEQQKQAGELRKLLATYRENEDLINIGAYERGSNPVIDKSIMLVPKINDFLQQGIYDQISFEDTLTQLKAILG